MKYYLDTNVLRQISIIPRHVHSDLVVSYLGIFETISGIKSEREYEKRKSILRMVVENDISIIWESQKTITSDAFSLNIIDNDVEATKLMMDKIIKTKNYKDFKNISFNHCGNIYTIDIFIQYDEGTSQDIIETIKNGTSEPTKEQRVEYRSQQLTGSEIQLQMEIVIVDFLVNKLNIPKFSDQYNKAIHSFFEQNKLRNYMKYLTIYVIESIKHGRFSGKNDGFDLSHLVFSDNIKHFVSSDKFYKRIDQALFQTQFITFEDFMKQVAVHA